MTNELSRFYLDHADIADGFGSTTNRDNDHRGVDIQHPGGTPIPALTGGTVVISEEHFGLGWIVEIRDTFGAYIGYRHMQARGVAVGTVISAGDTVGLVGDTGAWSKGDHLCFTVASAQGGVYGDPDSVRDPIPYIKLRTTNTPTTEEDDMDPIYIRDRATKRQGKIYVLNSAGKKRALSSAEWNARRESHAKNGVKAVVADIPTEDLNAIPSA